MTTPTGSQTPRRLRTLLLVFALALVAATAAAGLWARQQLRPVSEGDTSVALFEVEPGMGLSQVGRALEERGLVRDARVFKLLTRVRQADRLIQAGEYDLSPSMTPEEILERIRSGRVRTYTVVLPEGIRATEIAARLEAAGLARADAFLAVASDPAFAASLGIEAAGLEGYLYPETYHLPRNLAPEAVARALVEQFFAAWRTVEPRAAATGLSRHQIVTLASIVEKETAAPEERPLIAAVFLNRLARGMRLETDPTVIYGVDDFDGNLTRAHLRDAGNPYNTYQIRGLPPGPIASPGASALEAVVSPAETEYLFFVSRNDGTHVFSKSYREHVQAVNHYQKNSRNRRRRSR